MNEASKLSPFLKRLRERMPHAVVVKHRDIGMIGLPDFSITWRGHVLWCEAKLYPLPKRGLDVDSARALILKAKSDSPQQAAMMTRLAKASAALYVIWVKKTAVIVHDPLAGLTRMFRVDQEAADLIYDLFNRWDSPPFPEII